jgi:hypothetical protein
VRDGLIFTVGFLGVSVEPTPKTAKDSKPKTEAGLGTVFTSLVLHSEKRNQLPPESPQNLTCL